MVKEIKDATTINSLATHITQSFEWGEFRKQTSTIKSVLRLGSYAGDKVTKMWQILFSKVPHFSSYSVGYLPRGPFPTAMEFEQIKQFCKQEKAIFLKMEPTSGPKEKLNGTVIGRPILPQHTLYIDLRLSEEKLLSQMHEKTRYNVRLAQKRGVMVKVENSREALENFIKVLEDTEKRQGFYSHNANYYRKLYSILSESKMVYLLNAYVENEIAAGVMLFKFKDFLYYPYGGSNYNLRSYMAPQLLHFEAIRLGKKLGCLTYDLWGSYLNSPNEQDPWWGFYRLKSGLGGEEVDFPNTIDVPLSPFYWSLMVAENLRWKLLKLKRIFS